jgi:hypothetical protein
MELQTLLLLLLQKKNIHQTEIIGSPLIDNVSKISH